MLKILLMLVVGGFMVFFPLVNSFYASLMFFVSFLMIFVSGGGGLEGGLFSLFSYGGYDFYSYYLSMMSIWVIGLMYMALGAVGSGVGLVFTFYFILVVLVMFFCSCNFLLFYLFFEITLVPTFFIVMFWGFNLERVEASIYLLMYMMFISFPLLGYVMKVGAINMTLDFGLLLGGGNINLVGGGVSLWDYLLIFGAFFVKLPIFIFHIWLPKAHAEAPVFGSMLLAAVMLKLGGYGLLRLLVIFVESSLKYSSVFMSVGLIGSLYVSMLCLVQVDMKSLVAYSSVVHMNFMLCSLYTLTKVGFVGSFILMISHGLCSSGLFYVVNVLYVRSLSRLFVFNKGVIVNLFPSIGLGWFLLCSSNFSFPFSLNFIGEVFMIMGVLNWEGGLMVFVGMISFFSGCYCLYLFSLVYQGEMGESWGLVDVGGVSLGEYACIFLHYYPLLFVMFNMGGFV